MEKIEYYCDHCGDKIKNEEVYFVNIMGGTDNPDALIATFDFCKQCAMGFKFSVERAMELRKILK